MSGDHNMYASGSGDGQRSGWRKRQTIEHMWKVASGNPHHDTNWHDPVVIAFAALVREEATAEANARANASWTLMCEKMVAIERDACAKVCDAFQARNVGMQPAECAGAIRARGEQA